MSVLDRLAGSESIVEADVEAVGPVGSASNLLRTTPTSSHSAVCSCISSSYMLLTCLRGTTRVWPAATGKASRKARACSLSAETRPESILQNGQESTAAG